MFHLIPVNSLIMSGEKRVRGGTVYWSGRSILR